MSNKHMGNVLVLCLLGLVSNIFAGWTGTWSCSIYSDTGNLTADLENQTLRQVVRVSIPGNKIRLKFSNAFGESPLVMQRVHIAESAGGHSINTATDAAVTFSGSESVTIPAGSDVVSDELDYNLPALTNIAITIYFDSVPATMSGHVGSRTNSYYQTGDAVTASSLPSPSSQVRWYVIAGIDVYDEGDNSCSVVAFGDSITDGYGTTTDAQNRWTDHLATRLQADTNTSDVGVLNAGIGATLVSSSGLNRLHPDVLDQTNARYLIVLYGVNDILYANHSSSTIISAYRSIIADAHDSDMIVYGGTIMPFGSSSQHTAAREAVRQEVNTWIRTVRAADGGFDAVIDFDIELRDPADNEKLLSVYSLDGLHPNPAGYQKMAESIYLNLFYSTPDQNAPAIPTGFSGTPQSYKQIILDWEDNNEADFLHYILKRSEYSGGPLAVIAQYLTGSSYTDTGLTASTQYYYVLSAMDILGNESDGTAVLSVTTMDYPDDTDPPLPDPATWAIVPYAVRSTEVSMTATSGTDDNGPVEYYFEETSGNPGGADSGWQLSSTYTNSGLTANTQYTYRVRMRDDLGNIGSYSSSESVTTPEGPGEFLEASGVLSMEAENGIVGSRWIIGNNTIASNDSFIEIDPSYNYTGTSSPECDTAECIASYKFSISTAGIYNFWFRAVSNTANDDSFFWRIDGGSWHFENGRSGASSWYSSLVDSINVGSHTLEIGYRENGTQLDKFVIQLVSIADPSGDGPPESSQGSNDSVEYEVLAIDFGTPASPLQAGCEAYTASHEQTSTFTTQSYSAFGAIVNITPSWADDAVAAVMQMVNRGTGDYEDATEAFMQDWIGSDTRSTGDPLTFTISGLPAGNYNWRSYHTDTGTSATVGTFDVTVNDLECSPNLEPVFMRVKLPNLV